MQPNNQEIPLKRVVKKKKKYSFMNRTITLHEINKRMDTKKNSLM